MKKKFYQFLRDNNCLVEFLINTVQDKQPNKRTLTNVLKNWPVDAINAAFYWDETSEGFQYWSDLSYAWSHSIK